MTHGIVAFRDVRRDGCSGGFLQHPDDFKMRALSVSAHPYIRDGTLHHNREKEKGSPPESFLYALNKLRIASSFKSL